MGRGGLLLLCGAPYAAGLVVILEQNLAGTLTLHRSYEVMCEYYANAMMIKALL
jgi:hypothetical protein